MPFRILDPRQAADEVRRIAREQIDRALGEIDDASLERGPTVHSVRKRCKKLRGLLRLVRKPLGKAYKRENACFRDASKSLADLRDAEVMVETHDALMERFGDEVRRSSFAPVKGKLTRRLNELVGEEQDVDERLAAFRAEMVAARERVADWPLDPAGFKPLAKGLRKTYRRGRKAMRRALRRERGKDFHQWRKRVKYHWYHLRLLEDCWPAVVGAREEALDRLSDLLGDEHDLSVFRHRVTGGSIEIADESRREALLALVDRRQSELRDQAKRVGRRVFSRDEHRLAEEMAGYWKVWRRELGS